MNVLLIGAPASGKGTQGDRLSQRLGLEHIAAGDRLRAEATAGTPLGKEIAPYLDRGELVPDRLVIDLILPEVLAAAQRNGYILEGFPRSVSQATLAEQAGPGPDVVIFLDAPRDVLIERTLARAQAEGRSDDTEDVVHRRLRVFDEVTKPLVDYYRGQGLLHTVDASQDVDDVTKDILAALEP
ncbi:adenylate kinase [Kribbella pittospori]|uniref:Adenylate kinase n=1 Tax=Kribbella pittospori TaxID=722689 RepID=A0A4R0JSN2_9ACTN|nr:adenylate kinase [Kribbella pittospori]TCC50391.1 adenylate kinase [Kribbella pittospori]